MFKMPEDIKQRLMDLDYICLKANSLEKQLEHIFLSYGVNPDSLRGVGDTEIQTEAFADIVNCKGNLIKNIEGIERVFLLYAKEE